MIEIRRSAQRGQADHGWLYSQHSFSFASYYDPAHMGWGNLRVINEDRIAAGSGFGAHGHQDMEIISYVMQGALSHSDSLGNQQTIVPGEVQRMTAGTGVVHSERNQAEGESTHFLQIWLLPERPGLTPGYEQRMFTPEQKTNRLCLVGSPDGAENSVRLHADARLYAGLLRPAAGERVELSLSIPANRKAYVFVVQGGLSVGGEALTGGDAALIDNETHLSLSSEREAEVLVFDLAR